MKNIKILASVKDGKTFANAEYCYTGHEEKESEMQLIQLYPDIKYQEMKGFGGAFTPSAASVYAKMDESDKKRLRKLLFSEDGLAYTCGRITIGACDFSEGNYSYCEEEDKTLDTFSIEHDEKEMLPMLKDAVGEYGEMEWMASPWSPPAWMKTNGEMCHGGNLREDCRQAMAEYIVKFIQKYEEAGIFIGYITIQNEPHAIQTWESCIYTSTQEMEFIRDYLSQVLKKAGKEDVKIIIWDHNKENVFNRTREICSNSVVEKEVAGIAFHWYSGDHFENLSLCNSFFPDKELIFTEGCVEIADAHTVISEKANADGKPAQAAKSPWTFGECYGHDMIGNLNHGANRLIDWNVLLNEQGGPNHVGNYCSAPIIYDENKKEIMIQPSFLFISHFSRFITNGSRRIALSRYTDKLQVTSWCTTENKIVTVIMNETQNDILFGLKDMENKERIDTVSKAHSIMTILYDK